MTSFSSLFPQDAVSQLARYVKVGPSPHMISDGAVREQSWCLLENNGRWEVFYYERGSRTEDLGTADSRFAAIRLLGGRLLYSDILNREG